MNDLTAAGLLTAGAAFLFLAALGLVRLPDLYNRMHAASKAASLGLGLLLLGVALHFGSVAVALKAAAVIVFLLLSNPVVACLLARAALRAGVPPAPGTRIGEGAPECRRRDGAGEGGTDPRE
jgi:multicomponent Na+:H+ antiporter subunit G